MLCGLNFGSSTNTSWMPSIVLSRYVRCDSA